MVHCILSIDVRDGGFVLYAGAGKHKVAAIKLDLTPEQEQQLEDFYRLATQLPKE